jgi:hypothetical protein
MDPPQLVTGQRARGRCGYEGLPTSADVSRAKAAGEEDYATEGDTDDDDGDGDDHSMAVKGDAVVTLSASMSKMEVGDVGAPAEGPDGESNSDALLGKTHGLDFGGVFALSFQFPCLLSSRRLLIRTITFTLRLTKGQKKSSRCLLAQAIPSMFCGRQWRGHRRRKVGSTCRK